MPIKPIIATVFLTLLSACANQVRPPVANIEHSDLVKNSYPNVGTRQIVDGYVLTNITAYAPIKFASISHTDYGFSELTFKITTTSEEAMSKSDVAVHVETANRDDLFDGRAKLLPPICEGVNNESLCYSSFSVRVPDAIKSDIFLEFTLKNPNGERFTKFKVSPTTP